MRRRICLFLVVVSMLSIMSAGVQAERVLTVSDEAIRILKLEEGFSRTPYWDYAQWTVGYGTKCPDDKLEEYRQNGISEEAAEELLRTYVSKFESELYAFSVQHGLQLTQNQFDALLLFSYNCGTGWTYDPNGIMFGAIVRGATGSELVNAFSRWCNAGGQIKTFLLRRRLCEANIYLNGEYSQTAPEQFGYVLYDACGGTAKPNVQGYDTVETAKILSQATREGYTFEGWYTEKTGGTKVEVLDATVRNTRLYARWNDGTGGTNTPEEEIGTAVTVTANGLNVRSGPGTDYPVVGSVSTGHQLVITETAEGSGYTWGKYRGGWVCLKYTNYDIVTAPEEPKPVSRMGTVQVNDCLRVRSGPSTGYEVVAYLDNGTRVEILEEKIVGSMTWGRITSGWVSMDYVELDPLPESQPSAPETLPEEKPEQTPETPEATNKTWTGTVKVNDVLRIRSGPSVDNAVVGSLKSGQKVVITDKTTSGSMTWGKIENGWICLDYVQLDETETKPAKTFFGTVKVSDLLRVRSGPATSYAVSAYLKNGDRVEITEEKIVNGISWGKIKNGWICLDYVQRDEKAEAPEKIVKTVTADCLHIRSAAGTANAIVGYLYADAKVEILEIKTVDGVQWGKVTNGWISMDYVK